MTLSLHKCAPVQTIPLLCIYIMITYPCLCAISAEFPVNPPIRQHLTGDGRSVVVMGRSGEVMGRSGGGDGEESGSYWEEWRSDWVEWESDENDWGMMEMMGK